MSEDQSCSVDFSEFTKDELQMQSNQQIITAILILFGDMMEIPVNERSLLRFSPRLKRLKEDFTKYCQNNSSSDKNLLQIWNDLQRIIEYPIEDRLQEQILTQFASHLRQYLEDLGLLNVFLNDETYCSVVSCIIQLSSPNYYTKTSPRRSSPPLKCTPSPSHRQKKPKTNSAQKHSRTLSEPSDCPNSAALVPSSSSNDDDDDIYEDNDKKLMNQSFEGNSSDSNSTPKKARYRSQSFGPEKSSHRNRYDFVQPTSDVPDDALDVIAQTHKNNSLPVEVSIKSNIHKPQNQDANIDHNIQKQCVVPELEETLTNIPQNLVSTSLDSISTVKIYENILKESSSADGSLWKQKYASQIPLAGELIQTAKGGSNQQQEEQFESFPKTKKSMRAIKCFGELKISIRDFFPRFMSSVWYKRATKGKEKLLMEQILENSVENSFFFERILEKRNTCSEEHVKNCGLRKHVAISGSVFLEKGQNFKCCVIFRTHDNEMHKKYENSCAYLILEPVIGQNQTNCSVLDTKKLKYTFFDGSFDLKKNTSKLFPKLTEKV